jgi:hypothetical protein
MIRIEVSSISAKCDFYEKITKSGSTWSTLLLHALHAVLHIFLVAFNIFLFE